MEKQYQKTSKHKILIALWPPREPDDIYPGRVVVIADYIPLREEQATINHLG